MGSRSQWPRRLTPRPYLLARIAKEPLWLSFRVLAKNLVCCDRPDHEASLPGCRFPKPEKVVIHADPQGVRTTASVKLGDGSLCLHLKLEMQLLKM